MSAICNSAVLSHNSYYGPNLILTLIGDVMGVLCQVVGSQIYQQSKTAILDGIKINLERKPLSELDEDKKKNAENLAAKLKVDDTPEVCSYPLFNCISVLRQHVQ